MDRIQIEPIAAFKDNYIWMMHDGERAVVVDPGTFAPVIKALDSKGLELGAILLTHLHYDHNLGVPGLLERTPVPVIGPFLNDHDRMTHPPFPKPGTVPLDCVTHVVGEGDTITLESVGLEFTVLAVPGHTLGHLAFVEQRRGWLFCGDTLFAGGCGKVFGGSMENMIRSLDRLGALPDHTSVYCAHEYTLNNLKFAMAVEPGNKALAKRMVDVEKKRSRNLPTVPSTIALELETNPFLRVMEREVLDSLRYHRGIIPRTRTQGFEALRNWKNEFVA
ncbi:hydroxyacylglutathione hydrolase [Sphingomonas alba]|uniref:Hydroxyacylglutathione hydrolase n=1 Tax=Sphingomonas alba TaxID=2908208 RepID=A0ABT0RNB2_9SPHN|nr:hydroxyacylglutathione hydrolase [Sphingomonas alba]